MSARNLLLGLPALIIALLLQAGFWVPGYETQGQRAPQRLEILIEPSTGDARLLNPILHADSASGRIVDLVFDGLLRVGDDLRLEPSLARRFELSERAFLLSAARGPALEELASQIARDLPARLATHPGAEQAELLEVRVVPPDSESRALEGAGSDDAFQVHWPARLMLRLSTVVQGLDSLLTVGTLTPDQRRALITAGPLESSDLGSAQLDELVPVLERNPEIMFWLRGDVRFHDGHLFDASDVQFTYNAIMDPSNRSPRRSDFEPVKEIEVLGTHRLRVSYKRLFSPAVNAWTMGILPEHLLDAGPDGSPPGEDPAAGAAPGMRSSPFNRAPVGTGTYEFVEWRSDEFIHLRANPAHHLGRPETDEYFYRILPDPLTQEIEFRAGAIDTYPAQPHQAERYREDHRFQTVSSTRPGYTYVGYNLRREPFNDPRLRRALSLAIDTEAIIRYVLFDEGERVTGPFANVSRWYDHDVPAVEYSPTKAASILADLGYERDAQGWLSKNGTRLEFNLITNHGNAARKSISTIVQREWQRLGIKCNVQLFEWAVFLKDFINPGQFDAVVLGWRLGPDPDLYQIWHSSQTGPNQLNFVGFKDEESDLLIERIRREYDTEKQVELTHRLHERIGALQPYTFLFAPRSTHVLDRKIVMATEGGNEAVRAGGAGDAFYHMRRWQKLSHAPD